MGTTTELGIDISTGDSVINLQKTTSELDGLIEKYDKLLTSAEKAEDVFKTISKAVGLHTKTIAEAAQEADKTASAITGSSMDKARDMIIKSMSSTLSDSFKGLSDDLKTSLGGIPAEIKKLSDQTNNMTTLLNNQLGGIKTHIEDVKDAFSSMGGVVEGVLKKSSVTKPKLAEDKPNDTSRTFAAWMRDAAAMDAFVKVQEEAKNNAKRAEEAAWDRLVVAETRAHKEAEAYGKELQKNKELIQKTVEVQEVGRRKEMAAQKVESSITDIGGWAEGKNSSLKAVSVIMQTVEDLMSKIKVVGSEPVEMFKDLESLQAFMLGLKETEEEIQRIAKVAKGMDDALYNSLKEQAAVLAEQRKTVATVARGYDPSDITSGAGISNTSIIQTRQERDLLKEIQEVTERVISSREKLRNSKGKPKDTEEAKRELSGLEKEYQKLKESQRIFADVMSKGIGITGSAAVNNVKNAVSGLQHKMSSLQGTIKGTEGSFKNMWGAFNIGMGKFLLGYHTISTIGGMIGNVISGMYNFGKSFAETGSKLITFEKQVRDIFGGSQEFTNREMARLKQLSDYYGVVTTDIAKYYATISKQLKEMGASDEFAKVFKENAVAAIRGAGLDSGATENVFRALQQLLSKNQPAMEEITQQLSEHLGTISIYMSQYLGKVERDGKKVYAAFANIRDVVDLKDAVSKGKVAMNDFVAAVTYGLGKIGEQAKNSIGSYEGEVARLTNAWQEVQTSMMKGTAGFYLSESLKEVTDMVKDPEFQSALVDAVGHITRMVTAFTKLAVTTLPKLLDGITEVLDLIPGIDAYKPTANANPALKEAYLQTTFDTQAFYKNYLAMNAGLDTSSEDYARFKAGNENAYNKEIGQLFATGSLEAFKDGFAYFEDGVLKMSQNSEEALRHQKEMDTSNVANLRANVTDPMGEYINSGKASWGDALSLLSQAVSLRAKELGDYSIMSQVASNYGANYGVSVTEWPTKPPEVQGPTTEALLGMNTGLAGAVNKPSEADKNKLETMDRAFRAEMERLDGAIAAAQAGGNWAEKIQKVSNQADVKNITDERFSPEQEAQLTARRAQATSVMQTQLYGEAMRSLENIDAEIESRMAGGNLKNELKTQYEDIIKWQITTTNKLEKEFTGLSGVDLEPRYANIQKAVERASEQALTQGNTPMEVIAKAEEKAAEGRIDAWESTYDELVKQTEKFTQIQIQEQWNLMAIQDDISGLRTEKEKKRITEATEAAKAQFKNIGLIDEIANIQKLGLDEKALQKNKNLFGEIYDADKLEETGIALEKLTEQMQALEKAGKATGSAYKELARQQQKQIDIAADAAIENASSMGEYLDRRAARDAGFNDITVTANKKRYEDMYNIIESGASDMGSTLKNTFSDAFTGTLDSWNNVWKSMKDTFLKTLASMIWEAKMKPITMGVIAGVTGMGVGNAFANDTQGGELAKSVKEIFTGKDGKGLFSSLSELPKSIDKFGKDVLQFGDSVSLSEAIGAGLMGFGIGSAVGGSAQAGVGGAVGSTVGNLAGQALASTFGAMAPGIGQVIGMAAGTVIGSMFAGKKITSQGLELTIGEDGLIYAQNYTRYKSAGMFGGKSTSYSQTDRSTIYYLNRQMEAQTNTLEQAFKNLGMVVSSEGFTTAAEKVDLRTDPEAAIEAWLKKITGKMADYMATGSQDLFKFNALKNFGESSADAVVRLSSALSSFTTAAIEANVSINNLTGGMQGLDLAYYASKFSDALGGSEQVQEFFDIITDFATYVSGAGMDNINDLGNQLEAAFSNIEVISASQGNNAYLANLKSQGADLGANINDLYNRISEYDNRMTAWGELISMTAEGDVAVSSAMEQWAAGSTKRQAEWDTLKAMIAEYDADRIQLKETQNLIAGEQASPTSAGISISPTSTTFWTDFDKTLKNLKGLSPEMAGAWFEAAKLAKQMYEIQEASREAAEAQRELSASYQAQNLVTAKAALYMKVSSDGLLNIARQSQALNANDLPAWFEANKEQIFDLIPGLENLTYEGETALDAFNRLGTALMEISDAAGITGVSLSQISGGLEGIELAGFTQQLIDAFGSSSSVVDALTRYNTLVNTEDQQKTFGVDYWKQQATSRMGVLQTESPGVTTENFAEKYRIAMEGGLSPSELYQWDYAAQAMEKMATAAGEAATAVDELAEYLNSIKDKIDAFGMTETESFLAGIQKDRDEMIAEIIAKGGTTQADVLAGKAEIDQTAIVTDWYNAAIADRISDMLEPAINAINIEGMTEYDQKIRDIHKTTQETITGLELLKASEEDINKIRAYETIQINSLKKAHTDYVESIQDKIDAFGLNETDSFLRTLDQEVASMKKQLLELGGSLADTSIAETYRLAAIKNKLTETMDGITSSIEGLANSGYEYDLQQVNKTLQESVQGIIALGGSEEDLAKARYLAQLQAQEIIKEAANAYITAYDDTLAEIENLKSEKQALIDAVSQARSDYMNSLQKEIDLKQQSIDTMQETVDNLKSFISSMEELKNSLLSDAGFLTSAEKAGATLANFQKLVAKAATGDTEARAGLSSAASSAIEAAKGGSYESYIRTFAQVYGQINKLEASAESELQQKTPELEAMIASRDSLQAIYDKLEAAADTTLSINDARVAYENAQIALSNSSLDAQIAAAQAEADRHKATIELLKQQYDETVTLSKASQNYFAAVNEASRLDLVDTTGMVTRIVDSSSSVSAIANTSEGTKKVLEDTQKIIEKTQKVQENTYKKTDELLYFMQEDNKKLYKLFNDTYKGSYSYEETIDDEAISKTDVGLKVIVSSAQIKGSILAAFREANDLGTVSPTSMIGLLKGIKDCACTCQCNSDSCIYYGEADEPCGIIDVEGVATDDIEDTSELATYTFPKIFSTIDGAMTIAKSNSGTSNGLTMINTSIGAETPECSDAFYFIVPIGPIPT